MPLFGKWGVFAIAASEVASQHPTYELLPSSPEIDPFIR
jgi:hypothetical protein